MGQCFAAVDIGAAKTTVSVSSRSGILARVYQLTRKSGDRGTVPCQIDFLIGTTCKQARIERRQITAVGISTASPFVKNDGYLSLVAPNIGGGAFVDGHLLTGKNDDALHLGHIVMNYHREREPVCGWGGGAHLEALVSGPALTSGVVFKRSELEPDLA